jgi:dephospho-CoA kinase
VLLVGLTGGLGAGKSTVARMLGDRGAVIVDADELAARALEPGTRGYQRVCDLFGDEVVLPDGMLDRKAIAARTFDDPERRKALESIVHPEVFRGLAEVVDRYRSTDRVVVFDVPLLVETGFQDAADVVVVVTAPEEERIRRVAADRGLTEAEARARMAAQADAARREAVADVVIRNDGDLAALERAVDNVWADLLRRSEPA